MTSFLDTIGWPADASTLKYWGDWLVTNVQHAGSSGQALGVVERFYRTGDPLASAIFGAIVMSLVVFLLSLPTNNHSWVCGGLALVQQGRVWRGIWRGCCSAGAACRRWRATVVKLAPSAPPAHR